MPEFQTVNKNSLLALRGSGKLNFASLGANPIWDPEDAGGLSGLKVTEALTMGKEEDDDADSKENVSNQELTIEAVLHFMLNSKIHDRLRGDFDVKEIIPGSPVTGATQTFIGTEDKGLYPIKYKTATGVSPTISSVVGTPSGTNPTAVTYTSSDYEIIALNGVYYFRPLADGVNYDPAHSIVVTMNYTPIASVRYKSGSRTEIPFNQVCITTKNGGKPFYFVAYKAQLSKGMELTYPKDTDADRRVKMPIQLKCYQDPEYHLDPTNGNGFMYHTDGPYLEGAGV